MWLKEIIPFLGNEVGTDGDEQGRDRLLGKFDEVNEFGPSNFNTLVKSSIRNMAKSSEEGTVILDDELEKGLEEGGLKQRHLTYRVKVGRNVNEDGNNKKNLAEVKTLMVILRSQPSKAIEINGPREVLVSYKKSLMESFEELTGGSISFQSLLEE